MNPIERNKIQTFNLRVYGILTYQNSVLVTNEHRAGIPMLKFPGGGLEKGEGLADCLKREFLEEMNLEIEVEELFYVNEYLQVSAFRSSDQLISFYYRVSTQFPEKIPVVERSRNLNPGEQTFSWLKHKNIRYEEFTFPIDQKVAEKLSGLI